MPALDSLGVSRPEFRRISLTRSRNRQDRAIELLRAQTPGKVAMVLRRAIRVAAKVATDPNQPAPIREIELKLIWGSWDRLADILALPKRPAATSAKGAARIDLATILEAHPSEEPCTVEPVTEPAKHAESGPSTAGDVLPPKQ